MRSPFGAQQQHFEGDFEKNVKRTFSSTLIGEGLFFNETCFQWKHFLTIFCCGCTFTVFHLTYFCWVIVAFTFQKTQFFRTFFVIITSLVISVCPAARCYMKLSHILDLLLPAPEAVHITACDPSRSTKSLRLIVLLLSEL